MSVPSDWIGIHIVARTTGAEVPRPEIERVFDRVFERALGLHVVESASAPAALFGSESGDEPLSLHIQRRPGWTGFALLPITPDHIAAHGASSFEQLFETLCVLLNAHVARTVQSGGWALVTPSELVGQIDCLDWLQYFGPRFSSWIARRGHRAADGSIRPLPDGATILRLDIDPFEATWRTRVDVASDLDITLRPLPEDALSEVSDEQRLLDVLPPEPRRWEPAQRSEMLAARGQTMSAIETGMADSADSADSPLLERFQRHYLQAGLESPLLDRIDTWLSHYGQDPTIAAFRAVARVHGKHATAALFDDEALEGCVKLIAWGGDEMSLAKRALLLEHTLDTDLPELETSRFARNEWDRDVVAGLMSLSAALLMACQCDRCAEVRKSPEL